jgi:hypothetical protein
MLRRARWELPLVRHCWELPSWKVEVCGMRGHEVVVVGTGVLGMAIAVAVADAGLPLPW